MTIDVSRLQLQLAAMQDMQACWPMRACSPVAPLDRVCLSRDLHSPRQYRQSKHGLQHPTLMPWISQHWAGRQRWVLCMMCTGRAGPEYGVCTSRLDKHTWRHVWALAADVHPLAALLCCGDLLTSKLQHEQTHRRVLSFICTWRHMRALAADVHPLVALLRRPGLQCRTVLPVPV